MKKNNGTIIITALFHKLLEFRLFIKMAPDLASAIVSLSLKLSH